jgi:hypothetical protein
MRHCGTGQMKALLSQKFKNGADLAAESETGVGNCAWRSIQQTEF